MKKKVLIIGYGITGKACVNYFLKKKYKVFVYDKNDQDIVGAKRVDCVEEVLQNGVRFAISSPSFNIKKDEFIKSLIRLGVKVQTEMEYSLKRVLGIKIGVTGTNGKSTTSSLIFDMLSQSNRAILAGNIGDPLINYVGKTSRKTYIVLEVSSYMLENMNHFQFDVACLLNLSQDHLSWHGSLEDYYLAKTKIFNNQEKRYSVLNNDDKVVYEFSKHLTSKLFYFSKQQMVKGSYIRDGKVCFFNEDFDDLISLEKIKLLGEKNLENVLCACTVAKLLKIKDEDIIKSLQNFSGLKHRLEFCGEYRGVKFYNDSKATNISSTLSALTAFKKDVILLVGGQGKNQDFSELFNKIEKNIKFLIVFGEIKQEIMKISSKFKDVNIIFENDFNSAFFKACEISMSGDVVLLSPACASFDEFKNFEHRGEVFCEMVKKIQG